ncbi:MAG: hypothetical protein ACI4OY_09775 [Aristaeellaceae bacterium]
MIGVLEQATKKNRLSILKKGFTFASDGAYVKPLFYFYKRRRIVQAEHAWRGRDGLAGQRREGSCAAIRAVEASARKTPGFSSVMKQYKK